MHWRDVVLAMLLLLAGMAAASAADSPVQLRLSHWLPPAHPLHPAIEAWAQSVSEASGGTITSVIFPAEQLGKAFDHYDLARDGIADFTYANPGYQPGRFPIIAAGELPFLVANANGGTAALDAWYRAYAEREMKDVHFCMAFVHDPGTVHARTAIATPDQFRGLKVRPAQATIGNFVTLLGGTNVKASAPEAREMLERGVADAIFFPWGSLILFGINKVTTYHIDLPLYTTTFVWVMNKARYAAMSEAQKKVIDDHCTTDWAVRLTSPWTDFEAAGRDKTKADPRQHVIELDPDQVQQWKTAAAPLHKDWATAVRRTGVDPDAAFADLEAQLQKYDAAY